MRWAIFAALAVLVSACARAGASEGPAAAYSIANECGVQFVELNPESAADDARWGEFGHVIDTYYGVKAYSHGQEGEPRRNDGSGRYQCTELVHRYLREVHDVPSRLGMGLGNGVDLAEGVASRWGGQTWTGGVAGATGVRPRYFVAGESLCRPTIGAIVSIQMGAGPGHVAIIRDMREENGVLLATLFEQHGGGNYAPDHIMRPGHIRFVRDEKGAWNGIYTTDWGGTFPVKGWTNFMVAAAAAPERASLDSEAGL